MATSVSEDPVRDFLKTRPYFDEWIAYSNERIPYEKQFVSVTTFVDSKYRAQYIFTTFRKHYELLIERYSRGDDLGELRAYFPEVVKAWEWALSEELKVFSAEEMARRKGFAVNLDFYVTCLWLLSMAICLEADDALLARVLALCGNEGEDLLFERLAATRTPNRRPANKLRYPKPYQLLLDAIEEPVAEDRNRTMAKFLVSWYPSLAKTYWHDCHKGKDGGGYFGYWCFEAASAVKGLGMSDTAFRDHPHYPKDLAAFVARPAPT